MNRKLKVAVFIMTLLVIVTLAQETPLEFPTDRHEDNAVLESNYYVMKGMIEKPDLLDSLKIYTDKTDSAIDKLRAKLYILREQQKLINQQVKLIDTIVREKTE